MQRLTSLGTPLASAASVILPEAHPCIGGYGYPGADPVKVGLHAREVYLDEMVAVPHVLEQPVEACRADVPGAFGAESVLHDDIEESVVVIIPPGSDLVQVNGVIILERQALFSGPVGKCPVPVIVIEKIGISNSLRIDTRIGDIIDPENRHCRSRPKERPSYSVHQQHRLLPSHW